MENKVHQELAELSPLLQELRQKPEGYQVPEGYFATMQNEVLQQIKAENALITSTNIPKKENKLANWWNQLLTEMEWLIRPQYAVAFASLALLLTAGWFFIKPNVNNDAAYTEPSIEEIDLYLEENVEDIDTEQLTAAVAEIEHPIKKESNQNSPSSDNKKLQDAKPEELDEIMNEMIQNGDISEDDLEGIL
jgi:hypothetical protein